MAHFISSADLRISVSSIPGNFMTADGPQIDANGPQHRPGAGEPLVTLDARITYGDITLTRMYDPAADNTYINRFAKGDKLVGTTITKQPIDADGVPISGAAVSYTGCRLKQIIPPKSDADNSDKADITYVFSVTGVA